MSFFKHDQALVDDGASIGDDTRIWAFSNIQKGAVIGSGCNICDGCYVEDGAVIGNNVTVKNQVSVYDGVIISDEVFVGANTVFINDKLPRSRQGTWNLEKIQIGRGATIGANSTILCGIEIGEYAFIGAGSVVTKSVPAYSLVFGNPATQKGYVCQCAKKLNKDLACICGKEYRMVGQELCLE